VLGSLSSEVLLGLLDAPSDGLPGAEVRAVLARHGKPPKVDQLLAALLRLETTGHVTVDRRPDALRFGLSDEGRQRAYEVGGGRPVHVQLLMADLVGYVAFTSEHGDDAGFEAASTLKHAATRAVSQRRGEVVKAMGDGFLAWMPPTVDAAPVVREIAAGCVRPDGTGWPLRAASHEGLPIRHHDDLFGRDVNNVSRLCGLAEPGQLVVSRGSAGLDTGNETVSLRGIDERIAVQRVPIR
jgi:class 3 adenylate cyclase